MKTTINLQETEIWAALVNIMEKTPWLTAQGSSLAQETQLQVMLGRDHFCLDAAQISCLNALAMIGVSLLHHVFTAEEIIRAIQEVSARKRAEYLQAQEKARAEEQRKQGQPKNGTTIH